MLEGIFITMLVLGVLFQVLTIYWQSSVFAMLSIVWFLKLMVDSFNIQSLIVYQPYCCNNTSINGTYQYIGTQDLGLNAIFLIFVFINVALAIYYYFQNIENQKYRIR